MIVKQLVDNIASELRSYEIFEEVEMPTPDGTSVTVLNKIRTTTKKELNDRIANLQEQIDQIQAIQAKEQEILTKIGE